MIQSQTETEDTRITDPVCKMRVDPATARFLHEYQGQRYYFCCAGCQTKFVKDPGAFLDPDLKPERKDIPAPSSSLARNGNLHTCPMHPEITQNKPGVPNLRHGPGAEHGVDGS